MYDKVLMLLYFVNFVAYSSSGEFSRHHYRMKRADIDLQTCIDNFDIHKDKIIRTQDSQKMGARYLNEIDLGSREECLRLCCETESCDVFVFEEKNSGSCYLFHCGPPGDFKCKFTHHVNYSSAILAINRHLPDLESQIKLTKHEQDLNKLRKPESEPEVLPQVQEVQTTPSTTTTTPKVKEIIPDVQKTPPPDRVPDSRSKCSRYQFECRSTGECIAIYNACDGIPQCADASDEALELGCPDILTTSQPPLVPSHVSNSNPIRARYEQPAPVPRVHQQAVNIVQEKYRQPIIQETIAQQVPSSIQRQQESDFIRPASDLRSGYDTRVPYENSHIPIFPAQANLQSQPNWVQHQPNQMPQTVPQYSDKNSHIFNHKESGLQVSDGQEISQIQYGEPVNSRDYPKVPGYYSDSYRPNIPPENWNVPPEDPRYTNIRYGQEVSNKDWRPDINQAYRDPYINTDSKISPVPEQRKQEVINKQPVSERPASIPTDKVSENPKHIQEKMAHELKQSKNQATHTDVITEPKIKIERHRHTEQEHYPDVVAYKMDGPGDVHDGKAETPGGAVLSLTFGLIITCIMAILIGCRLRVVRRRMRKGGKSYAHDADYLVNGMYL